MENESIARPEPSSFVGGASIERRSSQRQASKGVAVLIEFPQTGEPCEGWVIECSHTGLSFSAAQWIPVRTILGIRPANSEQDTVAARVRNCRRQGQRWRVGCQFIERLPDHLLALFC